MSFQEWVQKGNTHPHEKYRARRAVAKQAVKIEIKMKFMEIKSYFGSWGGRVREGEQAND